jgi:hypothetical protein
MEDSILTSTKKVLGLSEDYTVFDLDVLTQVNTAFSVLLQIGIGPDEGFYVEDEMTNWSDFAVPQRQLNVVKTYVFLKTRLLFDPPTTSFMIAAVNEQIKEYEWRLTVFRDSDMGVTP